MSQLHKIREGQRKNVMDMYVKVHSIGHAYFFHISSVVTNDVLVSVFLQVRDKVTRKVETEVGSVVKSCLDREMD